MAVQTKPFWESSTLWINGLGVLAVILGLVLDLKVVNDTEVIAIIVAVLNILNRFRNEPVKKLTIN